MPPFDPSNLQTFDTLDLPRMSHRHLPAEAAGQDYKAVGRHRDEDQEEWLLIGEDGQFYELDLPEGSFELADEAEIPQTPEAFAEWMLLSEEEREVLREAIEHDPLVSLPTDLEELREALPSTPSLRAMDHAAFQRHARDRMVSAHEAFQQAFRSGEHPTLVDQSEDLLVDHEQRLIHRAGMLEVAERLKDPKGLGHLRETLEMAEWLREELGRLDHTVTNRALQYLETDPPDREQELLATFLKRAQPELVQTHLYQDLLRPQREAATEAWNQDNPRFGHRALAAMEEYEEEWNRDRSPSQQDRGRSR